MKIKYLSAVLLAAILITTLPVVPLFVLNVSASDSLGAVTECAVDTKMGTVRIAGSVKHSVLVNNRTSKIAVYRFDPWDDVPSLIMDAVPLSSMDMTIRFEFELPCKTVSQRMSLYAVAVVDENNEVFLISDPQYAHVKTADTSQAGFKGVLTEDCAAAVASHVGSAVIDVYLDKLDNGNKSGLMFNADGQLYYFDRDTVKELDKKVLTYTASGCDVFFRFLVSPHANGLAFASKGNTWATNKAIIVNDTESLNAVYAYTYFLISRYDGDDFGRVSGIIVGRGADVPILYNYAFLVSENYNEAYARSFTAIGLAAAEAAGDSEISLIIPISDLLTPDEDVYAEDFLLTVADYLDRHTKLTFTVMPESRHNPYKMTDANFSTELDPDDSGEDHEDTEEVTVNDEITIADLQTTDITTDLTEQNVTDEIIDTPITYPITPETSAQTDIREEETAPIVPERPKPSINQNSDGFFSTDNIDVFIKMFNKLKRQFSSVNEGFAWSWIPGEDCAESALGVCYSYNYMKLAAIGADIYTVCFEDEIKSKFSSISHLFKYIDTADNISETEYARAALGISDWSELITECKSDTGVFNTIFESKLMSDVSGYSGSFVYMNYSEGRGTGGWFDGLYCDSLSIRTDGLYNSLMANMNLENAGMNQAEIGYIFKQSEPLLLGDALTFDIKCGEADGSLYEITVSIFSESGAVVSKGVVSGGTECALSLDVSDHDKTAAVHSMKISLKRVTGSGDCVLRLNRILINSKTLSDSDLSRELYIIRDYLNAAPETDNTMPDRKLVFSIILLSAVGVASFVFAYGNDRRRKEENGEKENA